MMQTSPLTVSRLRANLLSKELTHEIIGAAFEVHRELAGGFLEKVYEKALALELSRRGVNVQAQFELSVGYKGIHIGTYVADLVVGSEVIVEIKAVDRIAPAHEAQLIHYLKATGLKVGLLLNFGGPSLRFRRLVLQNPR